jgi:hypothetical protein
VVVIDQDGAYAALICCCGYMSMMFLLPYVADAAKNSPFNVMGTVVVVGIDDKVMVVVVDPKWMHSGGDNNESISFFLFLLFILVVMSLCLRVKGRVF